MTGHMGGRNLTQPQESGVWRWRTRYFHMKRLIWSIWTQDLHAVRKQCYCCYRYWLLRLVHKCVITRLLRSMHILNLCPGMSASLCVDWAVFYMQTKEWIFMPLPWGASFSLYSFLTENWTRVTTGNKCCAAHSTWLVSFGLAVCGLLWSMAVTENETVTSGNTERSTGRIVAVQCGLVQCVFKRWCTLLSEVHSDMSAV